MWMKQTTNLTTRLVRCKSSWGLNGRRRMHSKCPFIKCIPEAVYVIHSKASLLMHSSIPFDVIKTIENWLLFCLSLFFSHWFVAWDYIWFTSLVFNKWYVAPIIFVIQNGALRVSACNNHFELGLKNLWQKLILPKVTLWFEFQKTLSWRLAWNKKRVQTLPKKPWII